MAEALRNAPLRRRLLPSTPVRRLGDSSVEKLIRVEFPRSADELMALQADVQTVVFGRADHAAICESATESDLICLMRGSGDDVGLLTVDADLLAGLIEVQTLGRVNSAPVRERRPTRTDAVMVSDMLDRWISDASTLAEAQGLERDLMFHGFVRQHGILDLRAVKLTLDPGSYASLRVTMALGGGARVGSLCFYVSGEVGGTDRLSEATLGGQMRSHVLAASAEMQVVLARVEQPLSRVLGFETGDLVEIAPSALADVRLEIGGGRSVARGRLGQMAGKRAIRLTTDGGKSLEPPVVKAAPKSATATGTAEPPADSGGLPETEDASRDGPDLPDLPDLPELPELPGNLSGLPADLPDLDDLPELPELPS